MLSQIAEAAGTALEISKAGDSSTAETLLQLLVDEWFIPSRK